METNRTNKNVLAKGLKIMVAALACMFLCLTLVHIALTNKEKPLYIPILIVAIIICVLAIFFTFKGINTILDSMFKKNNS